MNTAIILAGGVGSRMGECASPKQYLPLQGRPVIDYSLCVFQEHPNIDSIVIVAAEEWRSFLNDLISQGNITKFLGYADPGTTRQFSIFNGLQAVQHLAPETDNVVIHDAARPLVTAELISACLDGLTHADGVMPVLPMKDTCYLSEDGQHISRLVPRKELFAGQSPEAFHFYPYLRAHEDMPREEMEAISGSSEMAFKCGLHVFLTPGSENNIKLTTKKDFTLLEKYLSGGSLL